MGIPIPDLVIMNMGGAPDVKGTWVHPQVGLYLATWCDPDFYAQVVNWVYTGTGPGIPQEPATVVAHDHLHSRHWRCQSRRKAVC
jgi:KilA-N domain